MIKDMMIIKVGDDGFEFLIEGISKTHCEFCAGHTYRASEHYHVCLKCGVIFTKLILQSANCTHVNENTVLVADALPSFYEENKSEIFFKSDGSCSQCHKKSLVDGW